MYCGYVECVNFVVLCLLDVLLILVEIVFISNLVEECKLCDLVY